MIKSSRKYRITVKKSLEYFGYGLSCEVKEGGDKWKEFYHQNSGEKIVDDLRTIIKNSQKEKITSFSNDFYKKGELIGYA